VEDSTQKLFLYAGNAAGGHFDAGVQFGSGWGCCKQVTLGRFNNDDYDDLLTVDSSTGKLRLYPGSAAGANFGAAVDPGAGTGWQNRTELTPVRFDQDSRTSLLSKDSTGALVLNQAATNGSADWNDPIQFGPRD